MTAPFGCWKEATSMPCGPDVTALAVGVIPSARFWSSCGLCVMAAFEPRPGGLDETVADGAAPCCERATSPVATEPAPGFCGSRGLRVMAAFEPWPGGFDETVADGAASCCEPATSPVATSPVATDTRPAAPRTATAASTAARRREITRTRAPQPQSSSAPVPRQRTAQ